MTGILPRFSVFVVGLLLLQGSLFSAEASIKPTFARETSARVERGGEISIILQAIPDYGNSISFEIQHLPLHGSLSDLRNDTDHAATVTYHHDGSKSPLDDEFSFRAQAPGHAKSSVCKVRISVISPPAKLVFEPKELDFGSVLLDGRTQTNVIIRNVGGTLANGRIILPRGYTLVGEDGFSLNEGESSKLLVEFHPEEMKDFSGSATLQADCQADSLSLKGYGLSRFEVTKKGPASCLIKNISDQLLKISFVGDASWIMPEATPIPAHEEIPILFQEVETENALASAVQSSEVQISDGLSSSNFELPPPHGFIPLTLTSKESGYPANIPLGTSITVKFFLLNRSQDAKYAVWQATSSAGGGMVSTVPLELNGGEAREMQFKWKPSQPGDATLKISVDEGTKTHHELVYKTEVMPVTSNESMSPSAGDQSLSAQTQTEDTTPVAIGHEVQNSEKVISPLEGASWIRRDSWFGKPSIILKWNASQGDDCRFEIKEQILCLAGSLLHKVQYGRFAELPPPDVKLIPVESLPGKGQGDLKVARLTSLSPGWHLIVISRLSRDGRVDSQSKLQVFVPMPTSWWSLWKLPIASIVILLFLLFLWKQRKG